MHSFKVALLIFKARLNETNLMLVYCSHVPYLMEVQHFVNMIIVFAESTSSADDHRDRLNSGRPQRDRGARRPRRPRRAPALPQDPNPPPERTEQPRRGGRGRGFNQLDRGDVTSASGGKPGGRPQNGNGGAVPKQQRDNTRRNQGQKSAAPARGEERKMMNGK